MGFLKELGRRKAAEEEANRQLELRKKAKEENKRREEIAKIEKRTQNLKLALEGERQFEESGLKDLINELLKIKGLRFTSGISDHDRIHPEYYDGEGKYSCEVIFEEKHSDYFDRQEGCNCHTDYKKFIRIHATPDGTIAFYGGPRKIRVQRKGFLGLKVEREITAPLEIAIDKNKWKGNRDVLENALGEVYENPQRVTLGPFKNYHESVGPGL